MDFPKWENLAPLAIAIVFGRSRSTIINASRGARELERLRVSADDLTRARRV